MKTYIVENKALNIIEYCKSLSRAKQLCKLYGGYRIILMVGNHFGEGFHKYELVFNGKNFNYGFRA